MDIQSIYRTVGLTMVVTLSGCATHYTVDDGRKVDDLLVQQVRTFTEGLQAIRPAIVRSAKLQDNDCSKQWELPFDTASTYSLNDEDSKVAWVRAAHIDEHLRIVANSPGTDLQIGEIIASIDGYETNNATKLARELASVRDRGRPFELKLTTGRRVQVSPFEVCRGRTAFALPGKNAEEQAYHWLHSIHPEQVASIRLTPDEAQWIVLWTQGLSEEGGVRMKTYAYGVGLFQLTAGTALSVATVGAGYAAASTVGSAGGSMGAMLGAAVTAEAPFWGTRVAMDAATNTASLHGINWVASTVFDRADKWAFEHMKLLGMNAGIAQELEYRLASAAALQNAFLLDESRQKQMDTLVADLSSNSSSATDNRLTGSSSSADDHIPNSGAIETTEERGSIQPEQSAVNHADSATQVSIKCGTVDRSC